MKGGDLKGDKVARLADRIDRFDRARSKPSHVKPSGERPKRPPLSPGERKVRRWVFAAMAAWGGLVYALVLVQEWGRPWFLIFAAFMNVLCIFGCYGFYLFYAELGKSTLRKLRGSKDN